MIDETTGKPYLQVFEGPVNDNGEQHYYVCYHNKEDTYCVDMTSLKYMADTVARAFEEISDTQHG